MIVSFGGDTEKTGSIPRVEGQGFRLLELAIEYIMRNN